MKIFKYILLLIILFSPFNAFAEGGQCTIANGPAPELLKYIENIRKITSNITSEIVASPNSLDIKKDYGKIKGMLIGLYNKSISWEGYYSTWDYYIIAPMTNKEIPYEIKRDHDLIEREVSSLSKYLKKIVSNGTSNNIIKNTCNNVKINNCTLNNMQAKDIVGELLQDIIKLSNAYRLNVIGKDSTSQIKFGGNNFIQIWNYYNPQTVSTCSNENGLGKKDYDLGKKIDDLISSITNINLKQEKGIALWQEGIDLMLGKNPKKYEETEKSILQKELSRQGVSTTNTDIIMGNLAKYNKGSNGDPGYSEKNNLIENSFTTMSKNLSNQYNKFSEDIFSSFNKNEPTQNSSQLKKNIKDIIDLGQKNDIIVNIVTRIAETYQNEAVFSRIEDTNTQKLQGKLISMHIQLLSAINKLHETIKLSEAICNAQDNGNGKCTTK